MVSESLRSSKARSERPVSERAFFFSWRTTFPHGAAAARRFSLSVRKRTATAAAPWRFYGMPPTMSHLQVQKELALLRGLGRLRRVASLKMLVMRSLKERASPIVMPMIERSDEHPVSVQRRRAVISRTRLATGAQG
jgi:hypothetical protein